MMRPTCGFNPNSIVGNCEDPCTVPMAKPIRIFQFVSL